MRITHYSTTCNDIKGQSSRLSLILCSETGRKRRVRVKSRVRVKKRVRVKRRVNSRDLNMTFQWNT